MSEDFDSISDVDPNVFKLFTKESLKAIRNRIYDEKSKEKVKRKPEDDDEDDEPQPDPKLEQGEPLPERLQRAFPKELIATPLEDLDPFYENIEKTFIVVNKSKDIFRFSGTKALWLLGPFNPLRRGAIYTVIHPTFALIIAITIILNCVTMVMPVTHTLEIVDMVFTGIYTFEVIMKVVARGFLLAPFTYLRDPWNWLDFIVTGVAYVSMGVDLGNLAALRTFRVFRILRTVNIIPGLKTLVRSIIGSVQKLSDVIILFLFSMAVFALLGLQIYMGTLTQKCIRHFPEDGSWGAISNEAWHAHHSNLTNWYEEDYNPITCGNSSGSGMCPPEYTCIQGYGNNPNYGYTSFDTFGWSLLSTIRIMTKDYWENLFQLIIRACGPWHILFFILVTFFGSFYLTSVTAAIIAMSHGQLVRKSATDDEDDDKETIKEDDVVAKDTATASKEVGKHQTVLDLKDGLALKDIVDRPPRPYIPSHHVAVEKKGTMRRKLSECTSQCTDFFCIWECCSPWVKLSKVLSVIVFDSFFELFIILCIILNTIFLALDHHDMVRDMEKTLKTGNYIFTLIFAIEAVLKIIAMSPKNYFKIGWNMFDFFIVALSIVELLLEGIQGLSVLRTFRLLRVLRLAKSWSSLNKLVVIMSKSLGILTNIIIVIFITIFIFAVMGMNIYGSNYIDHADRFYEGDIPRWNFTDFLHSFMLIFRVLCGEWIESLWDCALVSGSSCFSFFLVIAGVGNLVVLNGFLALLLSNFGQTDNPSITASSDDNESNAVTESINRILKLVGLKSKQAAETEENNLNQEAIELGDEENDTPDDNPQNCCPSFGKTNTVGTEDRSNARLKAFQLVKNRYYNAAIITLIFFSSITLALEDVHLQHRPGLQNALHYIEIVLTILFLIDTIIRLVSLGFNVYLTNAWGWIDIIMVLVPFINLGAITAGSANTQTIRWIRILRSLGPLRLITRFKSMRVVVNAIVRAVPPILNVLLVCSFFWLIFAIMGVQLFAGKFYKCVDAEGATLSHEVVPDRLTCVHGPYSWENSKMNFDHVGNSFLCLLQVSTFKGWISIMNDAVDSRDIEKQPIREANIYMYLYFVLFIIFGSFFTLNVFLGVIVDNFNNFKQKKNVGGPLELFMTKEQQVTYNEKLKMKHVKPDKQIPIPKWRVQEIVYDFVTDYKFELFILVCIGLNMVTMTIDHYQQKQSTSNTLDALNLIFVGIFTIEAALKIFGLRYHYFLNSWNLFDFSIVVLSIIGMVISDIVEKYFVSPTLLRVVRIARVGRVLRLIRSAKGMRKLLYAMATCLPAIYNICFLLFIVMFVYVLFGMSLFSEIEVHGGLNDIFNFQTFGQSILVLFQILTFAGWDGVFDVITDKEDCVLPGNCATSTAGTIYILSYLFISFLIVVHMFIAVVLENCSQSSKKVKKGIRRSENDPARRV